MMVFVVFFTDSTVSTDNLTTGHTINFERVVMLRTGLVGAFPDCQLLT